MADHKKNPIRSASEKFVAWCADKSDAVRVERTVAEAVVIGTMDFVATINGLPPWASALITLIGMPVATIFLSEVGKRGSSNG